MLKEVDSLQQIQQFLEMKKQVNRPAIVLNIGKYVLEYPENHSKKKPIHKEAMKQLRNEQSDTLDMSWGKYKRFKWDKVLNYLKKCEAQRVLAYGNSDKNILISLSKVYFSNLTMLDLRECQIQNIQSMASGPKLNYLSLTGNNICKISTLKKCQLKSLKTLLLNDNPLVILNTDRCDFQLESYWLERKYNTKTIRQCLSQTNIFKLKSEKMIDISIESTDRIYQKRHIKSIQSKFSKLERLFYTEFEDDSSSLNQFIAYISDQDEEVLAAENAVHQPEQNIDPHALHHIYGQDEQDWMIEEHQSQKSDQMEEDMEENNSFYNESEQSIEKAEDRQETPEADTQW